MVQIFLDKKYKRKKKKIRMKPKIVNRENVLTIRTSIHIYKLLHQDHNSNWKFLHQQFP